MNKQTIKKRILKYEFNNDRLWGHITIRVRKRLPEFWKFFEERLSHEEIDLIQINNWTDLDNYYENLIIKQVYSMAVVDGLYKQVKKQERLVTEIDDEKLDNLIELCLDLPTLISSMLFRDKRKVMYQLQDVIMELKKRNAIGEGINISEGNKLKLLDSKEEIEIKIKLIKEKLRNNGFKPTQIAVSDSLKIPNSTLRDKLQKYGINFHKL